MNNDIELLIKTFDTFNCEFEIVDNLGESIYKTKLYDEVKNNSNKLDNNIVLYQENYYEYSRKNIDNYYVNMYYDVTNYQKQIMMLKEDILTTLPNRFAIELFLSNNIGIDFIVAICDIDDFKQINDTYGHQQGDLVLRELGTNLKRLLNQDTFVGRYGGEEFILFFRNCNLKYVKDRLIMLREQMNNSEVLNNDKYKITISCGISQMSSDSTLKSAIKDADEALYFVKRNGKNADAIYNKENNISYIID